MIKQKINFSMICTIINEEKNIANFLNSIINQSKKPDELIIVDAGSIDNTIKIIRKYQKRYPWIKLFIAPGLNRGEGRNLAIKKAKGKVIVSTDAGCLLDKYWLKEITEPFKNPNIDIVVGVYKPYYKNDFEYFQGLSIIKDPKKIFKNPTRMSIRSMAFKKDVWKKEKGLPQTYSGDDTLFNLSLIKKGYNFAYKKSAVIYWIMRESPKQLFKQFYSYAQGDVWSGNLPKLKKNLIFFIFISIIILLLIFLLFYNFKLFFVLIGIVILLLLLFGVFNSIKFKNIKAIVYMPYIYLIKRMAYFFGLWNGILNFKKNKCINKNKLKNELGK